MEILPRKAPDLSYLHAHQAEILQLIDHYGGERVQVFGSVARGEAKPDSDIDLVVRFRKGSSLYELSALWQALQELLGYPVHLISEGGLSEEMHAAIREELTALV